MQLAARLKNTTHRDRDQDCGDILDVAASIIADIEAGDFVFPSIVRKGLRLARLVHDEEMTKLLTYEQRGYPPDDPIAQGLLARTNRRGDAGEDGKAYYHPQSAGELDHVIRGYQHQIEALKSFKPSGQWASVQFQNQVTEIGKYNSYAAKKVRIRDTVVALVYDFSLRVLSQYRFLEESAEIFQFFQRDVEKRLEEHSEIFAKWPSVFERLSKGDREAISHALTSCRRIVDRLAAILSPGVDGQD